MMRFRRGLVSSRSLLSPHSERSLTSNLSPFLGTVELDERRREHLTKSASKTCFRCFHSTEKREIVPLIAVGTLFVLGRYSYKALKRMDEEWEEYQWQLQQYEKQKLRTNPQQQQNNIRSVAVDLGSIYTKLALSYPQPEIIVTREGDRSFFNGLVYENGKVLLRGRAALDKFYLDDDGTETMNVRLPYNALNGDAVDQESATSIVSDVLSPALTEALERLDYKTDEQRLRAIVTVPAQQHVVQSDLYAAAFSNIWKQEKHDTVLVPDPVAAIWGSQSKLVLPVDEADRQAHKTLVVDVGGLTTQLSVVSKDIVNHSMALPWGGETFIELVIEMLQKESPAPLKDARSLSALQIHARTAVGELAARSQAPVHVPYLFPDPANHHLETKVSRSVLEHAVNADIRDHLVPSIDGSNLLSTVMPQPTDITSLFTSVITQVLEQSQDLPADINHVLLIGGGSKMPMVKSSLSSALFNLMGTDASAKLVVPETSLVTELTALGAATMLPTYDYTVEQGLHRVRDE